VLISRRIRHQFQREVWRAPVVPFRVFGIAARRDASPHHRRPLGFGCSFRVPGSLAYRPHGFCETTVPLAVSPAAWFSASGLRRPQLSDRRALSSSFAFLQSLAQRILAGRPQPADASLGLSVPTAHEGSEVHFRGPCQVPATFRPQGLATLSAAYSLRARAGLVSCRRRSWDSPFGASSSRKVSAAFPRWRSPRTVLPVGAPAAEAMGRPNGPRFLGCDPSRSPWRPDGG
jgi:hypothetical protein